MQQMITQKSTIALTGIGLLAALAVGTAVYATAPNGIKMTWDGYFYIDGALNIMSGEGYTTTIDSPATAEAYPITHFPPATSLLMAASNTFVPDFFVALRVLSLACYGLSVVVFGFLLYRTTGSFWAGIVGTLLFITARGVVFSLYLSAVSEGPFLLFYFTCVYCLGLYFESHATRWLVTAGLLAGAAFMTRYSGIVIVATCGFYLFFISREEIQIRFKRALIFGTSVSVVAVPFFIRNIFAVGRLTSRNVGFYQPNQREWGTLFTNIAEWGMPESLLARLPVIAHVGVVALLFSGISVFYILMLLRRRSSEGSLQWRVVPDLMVLFCFSYLPFLVISKIYFDKDIDFNTRQLLPFALSLIVIIITSVENFVATNRRRLVTLFVGFFAMGFIAFYTRSFAATIVELRKPDVMKDSNLIAMVSHFEPDRLVYTNEEPIIELYTGRNVSPLPRRVIFMNKEPWENQSYDDEVVAMLESLAEQGGSVVFFFSSAIEYDSIVDDLTAGLGKFESKLADDGIVFTIEPFQSHR